MRRSMGFTLLELIIVISVIAIIASIAVPSLISGRLAANETVAIGNLRTIANAQSQFRESDKADEDLDGQGEHGSFGELSGLVGVRGGDKKVPTDLSGSMRLITPAGEMKRSGYIYRMYLADDTGLGMRENPGGGYNLGQVDADLAEVVWVCYAWPSRYGVSGRRTFFLSHHGDILATDNPLYTGANCPDVRAGAAFRTTILDSITGIPATGTVAADGNVWRPLQ